MNTNSFFVLMWSTVALAGCGGERLSGAGPARPSRTEELALITIPSLLDQPTAWTGDLVPSDGDRYALAGGYRFHVDQAQAVTLRKLYGAAACAGDAVTIAPATFAMRAVSGAGEEVSGELARGADAHSLGMLEAGEYTLSFEVVASAPCSIAVAFVGEST